MRSLTCLTAALASIWLRAIAAQDLPPYLPGANITTSGNGCPQNGANGKYVNATGDFEEMDFTFHNFTAVYGSNSSVALRTTACEAHISVEDAPSGWQVSPENFTVSGFAVLEPGTTLSVYITVYWSDDASNTLSVVKQYQNSGNDTVTSFVEFDSEDSELWSNCVGSDGNLPTLNINFRAALTSTGYNADGTLPFAYFGPLELDGDEEYPVTEDVTYKWQACNGTSSS